jgi:hypothetical protein
VGGAAEKAAAVLTENGFRRTRPDSGEGALYFSKGKMTVLLAASETSVITEIRVFLAETNIRHIVF